MTAEVWPERVAARYDESSAYMFAPAVLDPAVTFLASLAGDGPALEFAVGTGRVALPLLARGIPVSGIEQSPHMVAELSKKPGAGEISVTVGDMASTTVSGRFSLVYLVYNSISNLLTQEAQTACFVNAARHLDPGGSFVVEMLTPDLQRLPPGETARAFHVGRHHLGFDTYDLLGQRLTSHHYWPEEGRSETSEHRYVWPSELDLMARIAGMTLRERWADWDRSPFTATSPSGVSVWVKDD